MKQHLARVVDNRLLWGSTQVLRIQSPEIARAMRGRVVLDPYRTLERRAALAAGLDYYALGAPPARIGEQASC